MELWLTVVCRKDFGRNNGSYTNFKLTQNYDAIDKSYRYIFLKDTIPSKLQHSMNSTFLPTQLFCDGPSEKQRK